MYEANFEISQPTINVDVELVQNSITAEVLLNITPNKTSQLINDSGYITIDDVPTNLSQLVNDVGFITMSALIPLQEDVLDIKGDILDLQNKKVDKVTGKGLSTNDFTNAFKTKLQGIEAGAEVNKVNSVNGQVGDVVIEIPDSATWGNITGTLSNQTDLQTALNGKQPTITDLETIRTGADKGATALQPNDNITQLVNNAGYITNSALTPLQNDITTINSKIPSQATSSNQLADKSFVNSSIATNTANFIGTFNSVAELEAYSGTVTNNDYAFVKGTDSAGNTVYDRYKYNADDEEWLFEYELNNSSFTADQWASINSGITSGDVSLINTALQPNDDISELNNDAGYITINDVDLSSRVPYSGATGAVDLNAQDLKNIDNLAVGSSTIDSNEKILSIGQNRIVTNNNNGLFISSTTSQTRKGMYGVPMALEIQFNSNNQAYSYPLGFHDMNSNGNGGQFLFTSFSSNIGAATAGDVMVENDKGGLIFNTGNSKSGSKMRFTVGNWQSTPQLTLTANSVGVKNLNPNSNYALDVTGTINASTDVKINGVSVGLPSQSGNSGKFLTTNGTTASWAEVQAGGGGNVQYTSGGGGTEDVDLSELYIDSQGASYSFYYDYDYGTIRNNNQQVDESYAYALIELYIENDSDITISFRQSSEQNYDFGEISELDQYLNQDQYEDTDYVAWSGKEYSDVEDSITFSNVMAGYHFFTIKYVKDSSAESGDDTFEITSITIGSGSGGGSLIDTDTQEEIPLSEINDMPSVLQDIRDSIPDTDNFVTMDTKQMMTAPKAITGTDVPWGSDQVQKNLFMAVSNSNTTPAVEWIGRSMFGANNLTFLMGTINNMAALGAHSWTSAKQGTGAAWADIYINPDGDKAVKIGGSPMVGRPSIMVIKNEGQTNTGTVKINRNPRLTSSAQYKDVACWDDDVRKFSFTSISGYSASSNQMLTHDTSGNLKWVNI